MKRILTVALAALGLVIPAARAGAITTEALLDTLQKTSFQFFWNEANPANGLVRDRNQSWSPASIASQGFGLSAICVGVQHGWITRDQGAARVRQTLETYWYGPQGPYDTGMMGYQGLYYHFLEMGSGYRTWDSELSTIDTALLLAGMIHARQYFTGSDTTETTIRALVDSIYRRVDWEFMRNHQAGIEMGWKPGAGGGFANFGLWRGYNEAMILYILALGSPTHPVPASTWDYWTSGYVWATPAYGGGQTYVIFPPLFGHQYSHCWVDFRYIGDAYMRGKGITYFENSRRATLAQRAYAIANPLARTGYSDSLWGLTASDTPTGYNARGAPPSQNDDGTITPTAPASSIPFAPDECLAVVHKMWNTYRGSLWGPYGFRDAFNLHVNPDWYDTDYIGIDQGPIVLMIENYRNASVWNQFMSNEWVQAGLERAGFLRTSTGVGAPVAGGLELSIAPNPMTDQATVRFRLATAGVVRLAVYDVAGREVAKLADGERGAGEHTVTFDARRLPGGLYYYRLDSGGRSEVRRCVRLR